VQSHATDLRAEIHHLSEDEADAFVHAIVRGWRTAGVNSRDFALLEYAEKLTQYASKMSEADLERLRTAGWDDTAIHDATQAISYFNYINRIADALGVQLDPGARVWGSEEPEI
jgi:uncharacterized peroxidase-related enzyme